MKRQFMLFISGALMFTANAWSIPYVCVYDKVIEPGVCAANCTTGDACYEYEWFSPRCELALSGDCFIGPASFYATRYRYDCFDHPETGCGCHFGGTPPSETIPVWITRQKCSTGPIGP